MQGAQREHHFTTFQMAYVCFQMVQVRWMLRVPHLPRHFHIFHFDWLSPLLLETHGWFHVDVIIYILYYIHLKQFSRPLVKSNPFVDSICISIAK